MLSLETLRSKNKNEILRLAAVHGCQNVRIFGSVASNTAIPGSDVDFLVDLAQGHNIFDLAGMLADLKDLLGVPVDLVESRCIHPYIRERVLAEAVAL